LVFAGDFKDMEDKKHTTVCQTFGHSDKKLQYFLGRQISEYHFILHHFSM